jgi:hypothetical protein
MQYFKLIINKQYSGDTSSEPTSSLKLVNGYWMYTSSRGGDVTTEFDVREFLDRPENEAASIDFFNFLKSNISREDFKEIFYNNRKLSLTFNEFYNKKQKNEDINIIPYNNRVAVIQSDEQLSNVTLSSVTSSEQTHSAYDPSFRAAPNTVISPYYIYNSFDNYYINVFIEKRSDLIESSDFSKYAVDTFGDLYGNTITKMNLFINPHTIYVNNDYIQTFLQ